MGSKSKKSSSGGGGGNQRYDNPFERNNPNQMAADEKLINDAAQKYNILNKKGNFDTGAGSDIRNELERMRNKNYQRAGSEELKLANATNLGQTNVGSNQYFTAQQPTFAEVRRDIRTRLGQDAQNYGGGITSAMSAMADMALPDKFINGMQNIANTGKSFFNNTLGNQQTLPSYYGSEGYIPSYQRSDPSSDEGISVIENLDSIVEQISNSTRPTYPASGDTYPSNNRPTYPASGDTYPSNNRPTGPATGYTLDNRPPLEDYTYEDTILRNLNNSVFQRPTNPATGDTYPSNTRPTGPATGDTYPSNTRPINPATGDTLNFNSPLEDTSYVDKILRDLTFNNSSRPTNPATGDTLNFNSVFQRPTGPATGYTLDDRPTGPATGYTYPSNTRPTNPSTGYTLNTRPTYPATGDISSIPSMPIFSGQMFKGEDEPYKTSTQKIADMLGVGNGGNNNTGGGESGESNEGESSGEEFDPNDPFANLTSPDDLRRLNYFRNAGYDDDYILDYFRSMNYMAYGGSVAPQSGPMSNGIGTLYNTR